MASTRVPVSPQATLFGSNSLYSVLRELARRAGSEGRERPTEFCVAELRRSLGFTRRQIEIDMKKLSRIGVIAVQKRRGRKTPIQLVDSDLAEALLHLVRLLESSSGAGVR